MSGLKIFQSGLKSGITNQKSEIKIMAKESVKARQRKREKMVAQYAAKRTALKAAKDYAGLDLLPKNEIGRAHV